MESNINPNKMIQSSPPFLDLQIPHHHNQNPNFPHPTNPNPNFLHSFPQIPESSDQHSSKNPNPNSDEEDDCTDRTGTEKPSKKGTNQTWQRMKWTDLMVRLLITAVSYTGEDSSTDCTNSKRKFTILQKKGKWKAISKVLGERGCYVSPQQCEDKFNDLNKRYKRLTDILGRGTSCKVVENPNLLEKMNISEKLKEDAKKILSSKHLFYEEMCSYHNGNRLNLPADLALQKALQLALRNRDESERESKRGFEIEDNEEHLLTNNDHNNNQKNHNHEDYDYDINDENSDEDEEEEEENNGLHGFQSKKLKDNLNNDKNVCCGGKLDMNKALELPEASSSNCEKLQLERQKLQIEAQMLELERQRFKWERFSKKKDRELQRMRLQNEKMKLENDRMSLELKHKELDFELQSKTGR
ncbi:hypothetical protein LUZ60_007482 [Juncus effusus]|nr:hypothetical protein LUZ60_007482 [Juncus effusus]